MTIPTVRLTCSCWDGDPYDGRHTGICGGDGWIDVPALEMLTGGWRDHVIHSEEGAWCITSHRCGFPQDHDVNAGNRYHDGVHEMLFCCAPCMIGHLVDVYHENEVLQEKIIFAALTKTIVEP